MVIRHVHLAYNDSNIVAYANQTSKLFEIETLNCVLRKLKTLV